MANDNRTGNMRDEDEPRETGPEDRDRVGGGAGEDVRGVASDEEDDEFDEADDVDDEEEDEGDEGSI